MSSTAPSSPTEPAPLAASDGEIQRMRAEILALGATWPEGGGPARLKALVERGREAAKLALDAGHGRGCARRLSRLMDAVLAMLAEAALRRVSANEPGLAPVGFAVAAQGGYGRGTLAPRSDIDLVFLTLKEPTPAQCRVVEAVLYPLWDLGLTVGHATRSLDECIRQARADMTTRTATLDLRHLWGDETLVPRALARFRKEIVAGSVPEFVAAKLAERDRRHSRHGASRYVVEPDVKDGKGGLRDLHTLFWIAKYAYAADTSEKMVALGLYSHEERRVFARCADFLWAVRCHLHFLTGRENDRLSFDVQPEIARRMVASGFDVGGAPEGLAQVEAVMRRYFTVAKQVGDLTNIVSAVLEERQLKDNPGLSRFLPRLSRPKPLADGDGFFVEKGRLNAEDGLFARDPVALIHMFRLADKHDLAFHPEMVRRATQSLERIDDGVREDPAANALFLEILTESDDPETTLRRMNETGVLGRFVPVFGRVVAMMQFNMYHHFTVDEHLIRTVGALHAIESGELADEHPLSSKLIQNIESRRILYVAAFLHDVAKGRPEDHSEAGAGEARALCPRLGLNPAETDAVAWLIEQHLTMSMTAQSRDIGDPRTIETFAGIVQSPERLKLLMILTVCDIRAVGPGVWNGWKGELIRALYRETEPVVSGGETLEPREPQVAHAKAELRAALADWSDDAFAAYAERHYPSYWRKVDLEHRIAHARFVAEEDARGTEDGSVLAVRGATDAFKGVTEITVYAAAHPRLASTIAGACAASGANIVDAQFFSMTDGRALDAVYIRRISDEDADEMARVDAIGRAIRDGLSGAVRLPDIIAHKRLRPRVKAFTLTPDVTINNTWSQRFTVIEVAGLDRPGLLYALTGALWRSGVNVASAHIATFGERAVDVFYVTDLTGHKLLDETRRETLRETLRDVLADEAPGTRVTYERERERLLEEGLAD